MLNSYDKELMKLKPLLNQRAAPIYPSKNNDNSLLEANGRKIKDKQNEPNVLPPKFPYL
jgi:hypothetical protein